MKRTLLFLCVTIFLIIMGVRTANAQHYMDIYLYDGNKQTFPVSSVREISFRGEITATGITLNKSSIRLPIGTSQKLIATVLPDSATCKGVIWISSDTTVAVVDSMGVVRSVSKGGSIITAQTSDGLISADCVVLVFDIYECNVILPPDNEIWYTSADGNVINMDSYPATLESNSYVNGKGIYSFGSSVNSIGGCFGDKGYQFSSITLPRAVTGITTHRALAGLKKTHSLILPPSVTSIGTDVFGELGDDLEEEPIKHIYFMSKKSPTCNVHPFWNLHGTVWVHYTEGSDYSLIEKEVKEWGDQSGLKWIMIETRYNSSSESVIDIPGTW